MMLPHRFRLSKKANIASRLRGCEITTPREGASKRLIARNERAMPRYCHGVSTGIAHLTRGCGGCDRVAAEAGVVSLRAAQGRDACGERPAGLWLEAARGSASVRVRSPAP